MPSGVYERTPEQKQRMIELLKKSRETPEARRNISEAQKKVSGTPEARKANSDRVKKYFESPEARKRHSEIQKKAKSNPEYRKKASEKTKKYFEEHPDAGKKHSDFMKRRLEEHPELNTKHSEAMKQYYDTPGSREKQSAALKKYYTENPDSLIKNGAAIKKYFAIPGSREKHSETQKRIKSSTAWRKKQSDALLKSFYDKQWYGSVTYDTRPQYCVKFRIVKPKVRAFFNHTCVVCNKIESGRSHEVHHVFYDKEACCLKDIDGVYYSNLHSRDHTQKDYCIGLNPNYFILLCSSCHKKTNGKFETRQRWADQFKELIDIKYGGICWKEPNVETFKSQ
jgi:hypothetical protein